MNIIDPIIDEYKHEHATTRKHLERVPDAEWGQRVVAWVLPADRAAPPTLDQVRAHVSEQLPAFCAPKELRLVEQLPRTALGKVQRHLLGGSG